MAKKEIHPQFKEVTMTCSTCHNEFKVGSTLPGDIKIDTCAGCHPFYTGNQSYSNVKGRVERFKTKFAKKDAIMQQKATDAMNRQKINAKLAEQEDNPPTE